MSCSKLVWYLVQKYSCAFLRKRGQACDMLWLFLFWEKGGCERNTWLLSGRCPSHTLLCTAAAVSAGFCLIHRAASVVFYEWDPCSVCCCLKSELFCAGEGGSYSEQHITLPLSPNKLPEERCLCFVKLWYQFRWLWLRARIKMCLAEHSELAVSWRLPCRSLWKKGQRRIWE